MNLNLWELLLISTYPRPYGPDTFWSLVVSVLEGFLCLPNSDWSIAHIFREGSRFTLAKTKEKEMIPIHLHTRSPSSHATSAGTGRHRTGIRYRTRDLGESVSEGHSQYPVPSSTWTVIDPTCPGGMCSYHVWTNYSQRWRVAPVSS